MELTHCVLLLGAFVCCQCFSERENNFTTEFLYFTQTETGGHAAVSPYGVWNMLSFVSLLSVGSTKTQLQQALFLPTSCIEVIYGLKNLSDVVLNSKSGIATFTSQNYLITDGNQTIKYRNFLKNARIIGFKTITLNLKTRDTAATLANRILYDEGRQYSLNVPKLIEPNEIDPNGIILANVNSFQRVWRHRFTSIQLENFHDESFHQIGKVNMMYQRVCAKFANVTSLTSQVLELPYDNDGKYTMMLIIPYENIKVNDVFQKMTTFTYGQILNILNFQHYTVVDVKLPRFRINTNYVLNRPLSFMGVFDLFEKGFAKFHDKANASQNSLFVKAILQHTNMVVNETGLSTHLIHESFNGTSIRFYANRPFLYFVIEKTTDIILISGVYSKPTVY